MGFEKLVDLYQEREGRDLDAADVYHLALADMHAILSGAPPMVANGVTDDLVKTEWTEPGEFDLPPWKVIAAVIGAVITAWILILTILAGLGS